MIYNVINMEQKYGKRKKAFIGTAIGAVASIAGGLIGGAKKRKAAKREALRQQRLENFNNATNSANALNEGLEGQQEFQENFYDQYMRYGGKVKYRNRNKKAIGGIGEIIGGVLQGAGTITSAVTNDDTYSNVGNLANVIGNYAQGSIANRNAKLNAKQRSSIIAEEDNLLKYGGRRMPLVGGSKGIKVKPKRL